MASSKSAAAKKPEPMKSTKKSASFLSADEACDYLGIKKQTLYAYVSRGLLRKQSKPDGNGHLYSKDEIEALKARSLARSGHGPTAASAMSWGEPILESAITLIDGHTISYRGYRLEDLLGAHVNFENVAELLWSGELPQRPLIWSGLGMVPEVPPHIANLPIAKRLLYTATQTALHDTDDREELLDLTLHRSRTLILEMIRALFPTPTELDDKRRSIAEYITAILRLNHISRATEAVNAALIVSADHELNASTFAARVAASTGADLYSCVIAGISAFSGFRHGLASLEIQRFLATITSREEALRRIDALLSSKKHLPGFGHKLYPDGDPRSKLLLRYARLAADQIGGNVLRELDKITMLIEAAEKRGAESPNLDLGLVAISSVLNLSPSGATSLFALGRMAGWTAHILEQRQKGALVRPRARYTGRTIARVIPAN